ncbi:Serine/threonine-protein kinase AFC3-like protein [Cladobotryum mycophilum]|uniref:Serine/threonine-protein kinase AFC3-like protein n=1 Tax=Cladobotryum mycophilum TaxID=491253 RepID=A0ABR0T403_9HYPO
MTITSLRGDTHRALVFQPLRGPIWLYVRHLIDQDYSNLELLPLIKTYIKILLQGLDYMHSQAHGIHTDLKLDNILVTFEDQSTIDSFVQAQKIHPMALKDIGDCTVYHWFGPAHFGDKDELLIHPIQPDEYRAPEVMLGIGWPYSADMWNFSAMVTCPLRSSSEKEMRHWRWSTAALNPGGELVNNAAGFYGGPFFNGDGDFVYLELINRDRKPENELPECIQQEDHVDLFLDFMRCMLCWAPEKRVTAAEPQSHPWLDDSTWRRG